MKNTRRSIRAFPSLTSDKGDKLYLHMFVQDVHQMIVPFRSRHARNAALTGAADHIKKASQLLSSLGRDYQGSTSDIIFEAIEDIAQHLAWFGEALYEIIPNDPPALESFLPQHLLRFPTIYLQIVPREDYLFAKRRFVLLRSQTIWRIVMPKALGGASGYKRILNGLTRISSAAPPFWIADLEARKQDSRFNFKEYNQLKTVYIASLTAKWGWNRRDFSSDYGTEFLSFYRTLVFKRAQALLREHIIKGLNGLLQRLKIKAAIELDLTSSTQIEGLIADVISGKLHYAEALGKVRPA